MKKKMVFEVAILMDRKPLKKDLELLRDLVWDWSDINGFSADGVTMTERKINEVKHAYA